MSGSEPCPLAAGPLNARGMAAPALALRPITCRRHIRIGSRVMCENRLRCAGLALLLLGLGVLATSRSALVLADVGIPFDRPWYQLDENGQPLEPVTRQLRSYMRLYGPDTCYKDQPWCIRTRDGTKVLHWHLDTDVNGDLTELEKERADRYFEATYPGAKPDERFGRSSAFYNCHGYAIDRTDIWVRAFGRVLAKDYVSGPLWWPSIQPGVTLVTYSRDHTSVVSAASDYEGPHGELRKRIDKVKQKCGGYGKYETDPYAFSPDKYGDPSRCWNPKPEGEATGQSLEEKCPEFTVPADTEVGPVGEPSPEHEFLP